MKSHPHFMLFGGGGRMCPGKEMGTAEIATFLNYFVTRYKYVPFLTPHSVPKRTTSALLFTNNKFLSLDLDVADGRKKARTQS